MSMPKTRGDSFPGCSLQSKPWRLFFALWPDGSLRQQLVNRSKLLAQTVCGQLVLAESWHITLVFPGAVDARQRECIERMATSVIEQTDSSPFELVLDRFGHWSRPQVAWLGAENSPGSLVRLVDNLSAGVRKCGLSLDTRPYRPHLTLMRKIVRVPENRPIEPLSWWVDCFVLVRSVSAPQGVFYEVLREWQLEGKD